MNLFLLIMTMLLQTPAPPISSSNRTVNGTVIVAGTSEPIPDAEIAIATAGALLETVTDSNGRFSIADVPVGGQTVIIHADGFFAAPASANAFPQARAEVLVSVAQGAASVSVPPVAMIRGAIIAGKIVDTYGRPLPFATVQALRPGLAANLQSVASRTTDDQGEYRLFWVPPGDYLIGVNPRWPAPANLAVPPEPGTAPPRVVRTLFPNTTDVAQANKVAVKSGDEIRGIDISARLDVLDPPSSTAPAGVKISGQITNALMPTADTAVLLLGSDADPGQPRQVASVLLNAETVPFEITGVPPGKYDLLIRVPDARGSLGPGGAVNAWGRTTLEVQDRDRAGVHLTIHASFDVPGILKVDGNAAPAGGNLRVGLTALGPAGRIPNYRGIIDRKQSPGEGGKFTIAAAASANYDVFVEGGSANSYIADVRQDGSSILAKGLEIRETAPAPVEVLFATDGGIVEGVISNNDKSPAGGATVVLIPDNRELLRISKSVTAGSEGKYLIRGVRPGEYKVFAGPSPLPPGALNPELLSKIDPKGVKVTVKAAATAKADANLITD